MKANEAPEKIHVQPNAHDRWFEGKIPSGLPNGLFVEYTRTDALTDAFIKKACEFFEENIEEEDCKIGSSEWTELRAEYKSLNSFIRAFVKYMK